jgi:DNA-binding CsgD family transcriptional regulator
MNALERVLRFREYAVTSSPPPERLAAECLQAIEALGFRYFACCSHVDPFDPPAQSVMVHNYPRGWVRTFSETKLYEIDPVLQRAESTLVPFFWDIELRPGTLTEAQRVIMAEAASYGLHHGYTIPLHVSWQPGIHRASCSVIPDGERVDAENYLMAEMLATYLYVFVSRGHAPWLDPPQVPLTRRQRECLALVAQGKEDWSIGRLMGLSATTVHGYIEQLKRRLGVSTRPQAVAQALMTGQLTFAELTQRRRNRTTEAKIAASASPRP